MIAEEAAPLKEQRVLGGRFRVRYSLKDAFSCKLWKRLFDMWPFDRILW